MEPVNSRRIFGEGTSARDWEAWSGLAVLPSLEPATRGTGPGDTRVPWSRARRIELDEATLALKRRAMEAYVSQLEPDSTTGKPPIVSPRALERLMRPFEVVFT